MSARSGVVDLVARRPAKQKTFFAPIFGSMPGLIRTTFRRFMAIGQAVGPVNSASSYSGITITPELALTLSSVWSCIWRYASTISTLPLMYMRVGPQNSATVAGDEALYTILHDRPNSEMSSSSFWSAMVCSMLLWGNAYARKLKANGRLVGLKPLRPEFMTVYRAVTGELRYRYQPGDDEGFDLGIEDVFVVFDRSVDGYVGLSRIEYARNSLGLSASAEYAAGLAYKNGLRASGFLTVANWLKPDQREIYRAHLKEFMGTGTGADTDKQGGVMLLESATKFEALSMKPADVELLSSRRFSVEDVCRWFDTPPVLIGHGAEGQTMWGSGVEQIILGWLTLGLAPTLRRIEQEIHRQLLTPAEQRLFFAEFNLEGLLRADSKARADFYSSMAQNGNYTRNEIRARENLPPADGGDVLTVQSNLIPLSQVGKLNRDPPAGGPNGKGRIAKRIRRVVKSDADGVPTEVEEIEVTS